MAGAAPPKLVAPPEGLPPGWSAEERFYSEKSQAHGKSYIRFNGPNGRHKGIGSVAKAIELDAVDRGLSVAEDLKKWDDIKKRQREDAKVVTPSKQPPEPGDVGRAADARADRAAGRPPKRARASLAPTDGDYVPAPGLAVRSVAAGAAVPRGAPAALALALPRVVEALHLRGFGPDVGLVAVFDARRPLSSTRFPAPTSRRLPRWAAAHATSGSPRQRRASASCATPCACSGTRTPSSCGGRSGAPSSAAPATPSPPRTIADTPGR
ncbi:unnamed protein product [Prorocentrum cordatum]|uniref:Uncharacterized protein n=1 Tax=Prorocentrum cordatum TaxID=2364126 RepID=A0ABN9S2C2_9DINO|nr:unnamed protein product [Polarella glacialis]